MEILSQLLSPMNLLFMNIGVCTGIMIGVMPGLGTNFAITVLLTLAFGLDKYASIFLLLGAYCGSMYGGSMTAILINTPGTTNSVATVFDGYPLARQGKAGLALGVALLSSTIGGIVSACALLFFAPQLAKIVNVIASPEYFCLCICGLIAAVSIARDRKIKGIISAAIGLLVACVGLDPAFGSKRLLFGIPRLMSGLRVATCMLGAYALCTVLWMSREAYENRNKGKTELIEFKKINFVEVCRSTLKYKRTLIRSSIFGIVIGAIPGTGGAISAMLSYNEARRASKNPDEFGKGCIEGVVAAECGNNAVTGATLIPMLTMGIPGDSAMAILLGALTMQGIIPGPALFSQGSIWVYVIMGGLILVNIFMFLQGAVLIRLFANISKIPQMIMIPCIIVVCCMGAFAMSNSTFEIAVMLFFGGLGFIMKTFGFPIPPMTIAMVLGALCETNLRRSLILSKDNWAIFVTRPVSIIILLISLLMLFLPQIKLAVEKLLRRN